MRDSPRSPTAKTNGSSREGNRIINPHSRIPKSTNKQTNSKNRKYKDFSPPFGLKSLYFLFLLNLVWILGFDSRDRKNS